MSVHECPTCTCATAPEQPTGDVLVSDVNGDVWCPEYNDRRTDMWTCITTTGEDETWQQLWNWNNSAGFALRIYRTADGETSP